MAGAPGAPATRKVHNVKFWNITRKPNLHKAPPPGPSPLTIEMMAAGYWARRSNNRCNYKQAREEERERESARGNFSKNTTNNYAPRLLEKCSSEWDASFGLVDCTRRPPLFAGGESRAGRLGHRVKRVTWNRN